MRWTEISNEPQVKRFEALSQELKLSNLDNEFVRTDLPSTFLSESFFATEENCDVFRLYINKLKADFDQIRVGGFFREKIDLFSYEYPAELMQVKIFDSLVKTGDRWWPRNQLYHAFIYFLGLEIKKVDFSAPILIIGANADSKTIISALIKMGFGQFNITDSNFEKCHVLARNLKRNYFSTKFEVTEMVYITQLPNIYSIAVSTIPSTLDETTRTSLVYFNFLTKGALWIESLPQIDSLLTKEALGFGFQVRLGLDLIANLDYVWARSALKCDLDLNRLRESFRLNLF